MKYAISQHAKERYAERIMKKEDFTLITDYVAKNIEKIETDINKMIEFGKMIYEGENVSQGQTNTVQYVLCDTWVLVVDPKTTKVITLYNIDLGVGGDFNREYMKLINSKLDEAYERLGEKRKILEGRIDEFNAIIEDNKVEISKLRKTAKSLELENNNYEELITRTKDDIKNAETEIRDIVRIIVQRKLQ